MINKKNIADCSRMQIDELIDFLHGIPNSQVKTVIQELEKRLQHMVDIGLSYLSLGRDTSSLSGGESQRIKMVKHLGSSLTGLLYIFDEPSIGLHPADVDRLKKLILQLRDKGNTILVVEHDPDMIGLADHVVDMGPEAGTKGGQIMYEGSLEGLKLSGSLTGKYISRKPALNQHPRPFSKTFRIRNAKMHNLKNVSVDIPVGVLTVVTGVAGSGKSSLINQVLPQQYPDALLIDQGALIGSKRSHLASYSGIFDTIRQLFARTNKVSASLFSANSDGACTECRGTGVITLDLAFMDEVAEVCDVCHGSGYRQDVLQYRFRGKNIHEVLQQTVAEAVEFFREDPVHQVLSTITRLGLDYITLGQSLSSFSGGERQRLKLAAELDGSGRLFIFDEPTTGLHPSDIRKIMIVFHELVEKGNTVIVIEHNLDVIAQADWIIDIGPGAGSNGGRIIFEGSPESIIESENSITGKYLALEFQY
jgi:excinuclease ABC A subunit